jgi:rubrerythrin
MTKARCRPESRREPKLGMSLNCDQPRYMQLTESQQAIIVEMRSQKYSDAEIAFRLGVHSSSIKAFFQNGGKVYKPCKEYRCKGCGCTIRLRPCPACDVRGELEPRTEAQ